MVDYAPQEKEIIERFSGQSYETVLKEIPVKERKWKCFTCFSILKESDLIEGKCPICNDAHSLKQMCPLDHNGCGHDVSSEISICPICKHPICPQCGDHSVVAVSRVTGYLSDISGWNAAKREELLNRTRYNPSLTPQTI